MTHPTSEDPHPSGEARHRFTGHEPAAGHDTAGVPWAGRTLTGTGFDADTGAADARLAHLLVTPAAERDEQELVAAVAEARLIVPVVAVPSEIDDSSGIPVDAVSDMASVTLVAPDGQRALPAFTSTAALAAWNAEARPVPVSAQRAALAAVQEGCEVIPLDLPAPPGPAAYTLRPSMVWALAMGRVWSPAHQDPKVVAAVAAAVADEPAVVGHELADGEGGQLEVRLRLTPGLTQSQVQSLVAVIGERLADDQDTRTRIDALGFRLR
ncbi:SseB family protein [Ornithinimicrobium pratense]|uniref:SseB family protein n=1 Tax=Ornithinimicrobium pratense TaxID=2593973 RepID=A0A5J6V4X0_9MICO|nr:SseB family protein [Ornithinimicrobium pratense]QFG68825.1 SseB family protein [Ornithinimicrobium pratense]